jgi:hypothetical protein
MAQVIEFYIPARFKPRVKWVPETQLSVQQFSVGSPRPFAVSPFQRVNPKLVGKPEAIRLPRQD